MITNFEKSFNIDKIVNLIVMHKFKRVVLQFPDEYLACSIEVYNTISFKLNEYSVDVFITADSSYGSSVDDISALHVNSDCLVYFGGDITYIENIPVIISPPVIEFDISLYRNIISEYIKGDESLRDANNTLLIVDPIYFHCLNNLFETLKCIIPNIHCGIIPPSANLDTWSTDIFAKSDANDLENLASMLVSKALLEDMGIHVAPPLSPSRILYIGHKASSLTSLLVRLPSCDVLSFDPKTDRTVRRHAASKRREMSERFACVTSVQNSRVVGLVVGSMGVTGSLVRSLMADLQALIHATGRKSYCFVMGRLNDSKICNFPEIDVFCLISSDDTAIVPPKTFCKPVVTPFELQLGLGAVPWSNKFFMTASAGHVSCASDRETMMQSALENRIESPTDGDGGGGDGGGGGALDELDDSSAVALRNNERQLVEFRSEAGNFLSQREYRGLEEAVPPHARQDTGIGHGQFGIASSYQSYSHSQMQMEK